MSWERNALLVVLIILAVIGLSAGGYLFWQQKPPATHQGTSGIFGVAMIGPTCPGPQREGQVCEKPYQGLIAIGKQVQIQGKLDEFQEITRFATNPDGSFRLSLPPGNYAAKRLDNSAIYVSAKTPIHVEINKFSEVNILFDTGIR